MQKLIYSLLLVAGTLTCFWIFQSDHQDAAPEDKKQESKAQEPNKLRVRPWAVSNASISPTKADKSQNDQNSETVEISEVDNDYCNDPCRESLELIYFQFALTDDEREQLLGRADELAEYLRQNPSEREDFLELASIADADVRSVIMAVFSQLDIQARLSLGQVLVESQDWHSRFDGINFLSQPDIIDKQLTQQFLDMLMVDPNYYVRSNIIQAFGQQDMFYGNQEVLDALEQVRYSDPNFEVRGQALLTSAELMKDPQDMFSATLTAIRSQHSEYQLNGLRALEVILNKETLETSPLSYANRQQAQKLFEDLMGDEYMDMSAANRRYADKLYERNF